jgi:hypothetical protein
MPAISVAAASKKAAMPNVLPVRRWHSRQWQSETFAGSPSQRIRNWPQEQLAVLVIVASPAASRCFRTSDCFDATVTRVHKCRPAQNVPCSFRAAPLEHDSSFSVLRRLFAPRPAASDEPSHFADHIFPP